MATSVIDNFDTFDGYIKEMLEKRLTERGTKLANQMMEEYREEILKMFREMTASVCLEIFRMISMERSGQELRIVIKEQNEKA